MNFQANIQATRGCCENGQVAKIELLKGDLRLMQKNWTGSKIGH